MTWYSEGTVDVTQGSATVTGTGVAFTANSRVGDGFQGPDGRWYELTNYASDTVISIDPPYIGETGTGLSYRIAPLQGYNKQTADMLREIAEEMADFVIKKNIGMLAQIEALPNKGFYFDTADSMATYDLAAAGRMFLGLADKGAQRGYLLIDQVDNTADMDKPVSTLQQQALALKADSQAVDDALELKADQEAVEQALALKADQDATDQALATKADKQQTLDSLATKVDKLPGKALSTNDFTDELYNKLSTIEGSRWQGVYTSLEALSAAKPSGQPGWFAWVDAGENQPVKMAIWDIDDQQWRISSGEGGTMTPAQVLEALNANPDVNVLTDAQLAKLVETLVFTQAQKDKLDSVDTGAQKNPDAVSQSEAQGGTVTALRSWSVLRVWQAVQAWWNASAMKAKLDAMPAMPPADGKTYVWTNGAWVEFAGGGGGEPLLAIQWYDGRRDRLAEERPGWAPRDGQTLLRSMFPEAWAAIRDSYAPVTDAVWLAGEKGRYSTGDGSTTFRIPDINGATGGKSRALRGTAAAQGGSLQQDQIQNITGEIGQFYGGNNGSPTGAFGDSTFATNPFGGSSYGGVKNVKFDASKVVRAGDETTMANVQGCWLVKLAHEASNVGTVDVTALASEVAALPSKVPVLIKETYYRTPGAISHVMNNMTSVYEVEVWSGGQGGGNNAAASGGSSFGTVNVPGVAAMGTGISGFGGEPGVPTGGLINLRGSVAGGVAGDGWHPTGAAAPRGGGSGGRTASGALVPGAQPGGGGNGGSGAAAAQNYGSSGSYAFDRKAVIGGSTITGVVGAGGPAANVNSSAGGDGMIIVREYSSNLPGVDVVNQLISQMPKYFESEPLAWVPGGLLTVSHGLGAIPKSITYTYVCVTAFGGYGVGDRIELSPYSFTDSSAGLMYGFFTTKTSTQLQIRTGGTNGSLIGNKATGVVLSAEQTRANFRLIVSASA